MRSPDDGLPQLLEPLPLPVLCRPRRRVRPQHLRPEAPAEAVGGAALKELLGQRGVVRKDDLEV